MRPLWKNISGNCNKDVEAEEGKYDLLNMRTYKLTKVSFGLIRWTEKIAGFGLRDH